LNAELDASSSFSQFRGFIKALELLEPYLDTLVIAGGWVPYLYHQHLGLDESQRAPLTVDMDIVTPRTIPVRDKSIDQILTEEGFATDFRSVSEPPVTAYTGTIGGDDIEIEFLTYAAGHAEDVIPVQGALTAQSLHYLNLLYNNTWVIQLQRTSGEQPPLSVRLPGPGAFVAHKSIVYKKRREEVKRAKDVFYLVYVLSQCGPQWHDWIYDDIQRLIDEQPAWFKKMHKRMSSDFASADNHETKKVAAQRPVGFMPALNNAQFIQYVFGVIHDYLDTIGSLIT